jgi:hypothetical protein
MLVYPPSLDLAISVAAAFDFVECQAFSIPMRRIAPAATY